ncbi:MAG: Gfo/Idh/MocA family oxidoreductase [Anaerolineales bacterium]|nr:Gfo/Idh/MocA family oxidoreductase [Anaerolineales bacterium]
MTHRFRTALIGTSWWAVGAHLPGLQSRPDVELAALAGRDPARLAEVAGRFHVPRTFTDYSRLLAEVQPEVVVIATPNHLHAPMTLAALEAGAHVICEKPLALEAAEAEQMLARAEALGRRHLTFFSYRGMPAPRYLKTLIAGGYLGRLHHVQAQYLHASWLDARRPASWKTRLAEGGSGVLGDLGAHVFDLLQWWFGPATRAAGSLQTFVPERPGADGRPVRVETDDAAAGLLEFAGGGQATFQLSRVAPGRRNYQRLEMYGSGGVLVYEYDQPWAHVARLWGAEAGQLDLQPLALPAEWTAGFEGPDTFPAVYRALTDPFFASLAEAGAAPPAPSFADGLAAQRVIEAVARSALSGRLEPV